MDISKNGAAPAANLVTTSWIRERTSEGRSRFTLYAIVTPVQQHPHSLNPSLPRAGERDLEVHPRMAAAPMVVGQAVIDVPNLEIAKLLAAGIGEMIAKQGPEILQVGKA
jgi:hypothetical protein